MCRYTKEYFDTVGQGLANVSGAMADEVARDLRLDPRDVAEQLKVERCRLTVSKPVLKAPMVSALEATI